MSWVAMAAGLLLLRMLYGSWVFVMFDPIFIKKIFNFSQVYVYNIIFHPQ